MQEGSPVILIPARYGSSRFPGKPLVDIAGKSLIRRVWDNCADFPRYVITDDSRIASHVADFGGEVLRVDDETPSGGDRLHLAWQRHLREKNCSLVLNLQGDWPLIGGPMLKRLIDFHQHSAFDVATLISPRRGEEQRWRSPNAVKAIFSPDSKRCLYFSRAPVPHGSEEWFLHLGVYSYTPRALEQFGSRPPSLYEQKERLEQLRLLEAGASIGALAVDGPQMGVDLPADIEEIERLLP